MKILLENEYVRTWTVKDSPVIFSLLLKQPESTIMLQQFCDAHEKFVSDSKEQFPGGVYSICDAGVMQPFEFEIMVNYYAHVFPKQQRAGLVFKAFVIPKNYSVETDFEAVSKKLAGRPIGIYESIDAALSHIREMAVSVFVS